MPPRIKHWGNYLQINKTVIKKIKDNVRSKSNIWNDLEMFRQTLSKYNVYNFKVQNPNKKKAKRLMLYIFIVGFQIIKIVKFGSFAQKKRSVRCKSFELRKVMHAHTRICVYTYTYSKYDINIICQLCANR